MNSANNGPFSTSTDWATAATRFDPLRANLGEILGYVHTLQTPTGTTFRPSPMSGATSTRGATAIPAWTAFGSTNSTRATRSLAHPGRKPRSQWAGAGAHRPQLSQPRWQFQRGQVNPAGGYYSQLTNWIHAAHPGVKIIGNAGGQFYFNQVRYGALVDVTCSFEQAYPSPLMPPPTTGPV